MNQTTGNSLNFCKDKEIYKKRAKMKLEVSKSEAKVDQRVPNGR